VDYQLEAAPEDVVGDRKADMSKPNTTDVHSLAPDMSDGSHYGRPPVARLSAATGEGALECDIRE